MSVMPDDPWPQVRCPACGFFMTDKFIDEHLTKWCKEAYQEQKRENEHKRAQARKMKEKYSGVHS
jgi:hypothetical protein